MGNVKKLTEALRSGEYQQGCYALNFKGKFCCLGVACEVYQKEVGDLEIIELPDGTVSYDGETTLLPVKVKRWFGFKTAGGGYGAGSLVAHNDNGVPFQNIAKLIEIEEGLFDKRA